MDSCFRFKSVSMVLAAVGLGACALNIKSYTPNGVDFRQYRSYSWGCSNAVRTGDPRLDGNRFFDEYVRARVDEQLGRRGFEKSADGQRSELLVHYHASVTQRIDLRAIDAQYSSVRDEGRAYVYDAGTLVIDLVDARTTTLVWRGWAEGSLEGVIDNQASMEAQIARAVAHVLQRLPPRL